MLYLYLDESGDLGSQKKSPGASHYFIITVLNNGMTCFERR